MKAVFIGCLESSYTLLDGLLEMDGIEIAGVVTRKASSFNADFKSLEPLAAKARVPCLNVGGNNQEKMAAWIDGLNPDVVFCLGWSYLLGPDILAIPKEGVIGYHPALLPRNRGRHPIIWALALGLKETGSTFFFMDEGADSGDILSQQRIAIGDDDDAASLYAKLVDAAINQLGGIVHDLAEGHLKRSPQDASKATAWRKRSKDDGKIDWRMPAQGVCNLIRALTHPYPGAHFDYNAGEPKVWKALVSKAEDEDIEPGRVLSIDGAAITVKCGVGAVNLIEHDIQSPPKVGDCL
ncbi:MAG: formyl transferase [Rhodospirillales bacterium]|nr:formyl transferase [Rhodospirillales bacterium]